MDLKQTIAKNIKLLRQSEGLSQRDLANELQVKQPNIARWENGITYPPNETLLWYSQRFKVSLDFIYGVTRAKGSRLRDGMIENIAEQMIESVELSLKPGGALYEEMKAYVQDALDKIGEKDD